ncbi:MAG: nickel-responsive regulator 1 [Nanoarchaeota archaeon]|nr:nickel-responsive regulator 1 [Nanoarchaeota archaeon]
MAEIISISLNKEMIEQMNIIQKEMSFSGRSEIVRAGLRNLIEEYNSLHALSGIVEGTLIVTHKEEFNDEFSKIKHTAPHDSVKTHLHHELSNHLCMEVLLFRGDSKYLQDLYKRFTSSRKIESVKVVVY